MKRRETEMCWIWTGRRVKGYGQYAGTTAHRVAFEITNPDVELTPEVQVDHLCRTPLCVNPTHLEAVSREENMRRRTLTITQCKHGRRSCRECNRLAAIRYKLRRSA